jgi:predicted dehydrogenase
MKLRWGIIGLGKIAGHFARDFIHASSDQNELVAVASRSLDKARAFAQNHHITEYYGTYEDLLGDPNVDILYIATPHNSHKKYTIEALNAGKHVLCEKPMAVNKAELKEMIDVTRKNKVFLMEALWTRWNPVMLEVLQLIRSGKLGSIIKAEADFGFKAHFDPESRLFNPQLAGGALLDIGIYPLFLSYLLLGEPNSISTKAEFSTTGVDVETSVELNYAHNVKFQATCTLLAETDTVARITCEKAKIVIKARWHEAESYQITYADGKIEEHSVELQNRGYYQEVKHCYERVNSANAESDMWSLRNSLALVGILDQVRAKIGLVYPFEK